MAHFDVAIIGSGSGNSIITPEFDELSVAVIDSGPFGGTCVNVGCIPTKMYVYVADLATAIADSSRFGLDAQINQVRWGDIRDRIFRRIDAISEGGKKYRENGKNTTAYFSRVRFTGPRRLSTAAGEEITADQIVIAAGGHPVVPPEISASDVVFHTSDTIMRIDELPQRLVIVGGGYIAAEFAHIFGSLGTQVTVVSRNMRLLRQLDAELSDAFTEAAAAQWDVRLGVSVASASMVPGAGGRPEIQLRLSDGGTVAADQLLVATGRAPNTSDLGLEVAAVQVHSDGRVDVDAHGRTSVEGIWSLGDISSPWQLKHVANHEARIVSHNLLHPDDLWSFDHRFVPSAVFSQPQLATVGLSEDEVRAMQRPYRVAVQRYGDTAYGWAMEDSTGFCKVIADPITGQLLGAHLMGYQASSLIQPLVHAMSFGQTVTEMVRGQYWIHPALMEVIENALLKLDIDG